MFTREALLASDWYAARLRAKQTLDIALWRRHVAAIEAFQAGRGCAPGLDIDSRLAYARCQLTRASAGEYLSELVGTIGGDPCLLAAL